MAVEPCLYCISSKATPNPPSLAMTRTLSLLEAQAPVTISREVAMTTPPDDRARELARNALAQVKRLDDIARYANLDATEAQELTISLAIRNYFIERTIGAAS